ncbi:hypothetical protein JL720_7137 [Aureococcus anophagefferens]|nr:hypothetical protein JL720_7137 [Aureococcus anophagefferens]
MGLWPKPKHKAPAAPSGARSAAPLGASFGDEAPRVGKKAEPPAPREPYVPLELAARRLDQLQGDAANFRETRLLELEDLGAAWARRRPPSGPREAHYAARTSRTSGRRPGRGPAPRRGSRGARGAAPGLRRRRGARGRRAPRSAVSAALSGGRRRRRWTARPGAARCASRARGTGLRRPRRGDGRRRGRGRRGRGGPARRRGRAAATADAARAAFAAERKALVLQRAAAALKAEGLAKHERDALEGARGRGGRARRRGERRAQRERGAAGPRRGRRGGVRGDGRGERGAARRGRAGPRNRHGRRREAAARPPRRDAACAAALAAALGALEAREGDARDAARADASAAAAAAAAAASAAALKDVKSTLSREKQFGRRLRSSSGTSGLLQGRDGAVAAAAATDARRADAERRADAAAADAAALRASGARRRRARGGGRRSSGRGGGRRRPGRARGAAERERGARGAHARELAKAQQMITALKARTKDLESRPVGDASGDAAATDELDAARDEVNRLREAAERLEASARGAVALRKAFDKVMEHLAVVIRADAASAAPPAAAAAAVAAPGGGGDVARLAAELDAVWESTTGSRECGRLALVAETRSTADAGAGDGDEAYAARVAEDRARARPRTAPRSSSEVGGSPPRRPPARRRGRQGRRPAAARKLAAATRTCARSRPRCGASRTSSGRAAAAAAAPAAPAKQLEKKHKKELDELKKAADKDQRKAAGELKRVGKELEKAASELDAAKKERDADLEALTSNLDELRTKAARDMKGKIRVFVRCRPFAKYELEKKCGSVVHFDDDTTLTVDGHNGPKVFNFDNVFPPVVGGDAGQGDVFEDTSNLIQSCLDGFNVCIFAYGQTGSGKTFTMTGVRDNPELRGITPRAIHALFDEAQKMAHQCTVTVRTYFLELYNDGLVDLYHVLDNPGSRAAPPKLDVKLDAKKMVFVKNAVVKDAASADELLNLFEAGNAKRHVGATKMNAESSRSHSIFAILVEVYNRTTKKTSVGKLSLVDLAGSERADKTGATDERLKEAQNINKSLSALGDVISALSTGEKFIPYRNNKLTLVMQDSLGGNAKTLMFVNISPADYNADETVTSLTYASRVKLIKNTANKNAESEVAQLKAIIKNKAGGTGEVAGADVLL